MYRGTRARARALAALALGAALAVGGVTVAAADVVDPSPSPEGYAPEPVLTVDIVAPICDGDVPYLQYAVTAENLDAPATEVTITWVGAGGQTFVQAGLPLSGRVLWPGAVVDGAGNALDWPGWRLEGDVWVVGDEWDWVRPSVGLEFEVNPTATASVNYPESSPACATPPGGSEEPPPGTPVEGEPPAAPVGNTPGDTPAGDTPAGATSQSGLPVTGPEVAGILALAAGLLVAGIMAVRVSRRRRTE